VQQIEQVFSPAAHELGRVILSGLTVHTAASLSVVTTADGLLAAFEVDDVEVRKAVGTSLSGIAWMLRCRRDYSTADIQNGTIQKHLKVSCK